MNQGAALREDTPAIHAPLRPRGRPRGFDRADALARAAEVFWAQGYEGASIAVLTSAMGITAQSLYAAFGSKAELYEEALGWYRQRMSASFAASLEAEADVVRGLMSLLENSATAFCCAETPHGCMISTALLTCADEHAALAALASRLRTDMRGAIEARIHRAVVERQLARTTDVATLARFVGAVMQGMSVQARDGANCGELQAMLAMARRAIEGALSEPSAKLAK